MAGHAVNRRGTGGAVNSFDQGPLSLIARQKLSSFRHERRHPGAGFALSEQPINNTLTVCFDSNLADLPLALDAMNRNLQSHNSLDLGRDKVPGRVSHLPGRGSGP
jgi:hypothetical protein